jgi:class 3 adenylate cyclase
MKIELTQKEAQALLASANEMLDEVSKLDEEHRLSVGWKIMLKDFKSGIKKLTKQYFQQLEEMEEIIRRNGGTII